MSSEKQREYAYATRYDQGLINLIRQEFALLESRDTLKGATQKYRGDMSFGGQTVRAWEHLCSKHFVKEGLYYIWERQLVRLLDALPKRQRERYITAAALAQLRRRPYVAWYG